AHDSPCFCGFMAGPAIGQADVGLLVDVDVPWFPRDTRANEATYWAQIDVDVVKGGSPMWSFPSNLRLQGNSGRIVEQLLDAVKAKATPAFKQAAASRIAQFGAETEKRLSRAAEPAANPGKPGAINSHYLCRELGKRIAPQDVIFSEATRNTPAVQQQIPRSLPGTVVRVGGGGLGSSGGMALGTKLARPEHLAIQIVGDGSFYFNVTDSVFAVSKQYGLPIFTIVLDNGGRAAGRGKTPPGYPPRDAKAQGHFPAGLAPPPAFSKD